ncbi:hypothetical protein PENTCL1PPCAC_28401 [Pristionchus entomophagus]|uniref:Uncharacterized protein n=1 Tax=Pristionchus entomophagus TaxID=358040 RepID=A0AAV5UHZ2_9BILA|nr:hypothetical protein PENTCL1PPCAC_28401 [Pristionchus entomophagus]
MELEEVDKQLSVDSIPDIFNTSSLLDRPKYQSEERYQFLIDAAKNGSERCQILAVKFMLKFYDLFPNKQAEASKIALSLMNINEENLRLTLLKDLHIVGTTGGFIKPVVELYLQCTMSNIEEERFTSYDGLVQFLHKHWLEVASCIRDLLNKEHSAKNRKMVLEFLNDRMRIIPLAMYKDANVLEMLESIFKEEFSRANLTYVDSLIIYLGNSILMDNFEKQQSISQHFIETLLVPSYVPAYLEEPATTTAKSTSVNAELDSILVRLTILQQMTTILRQRNDKANDWFFFVVNNIDQIFKLPEDKQYRALRAFAQFTTCCSNTLDDDHVDKLFKIIQDLVPSIDPDADTITLPKIDLHRLEPCCIALYNLRHIPSIGAKMHENVSQEFRKRMRFLVRYCQLKSTEFKRMVEELGDIPMRKEMNALVAAATSTGLFAIEIVKPVHLWEMKPRPSWKSCWITKVTARTPKRIKKHSTPVITL